MYILFYFLFLYLYFSLKFFSKEEIFDFIEKSKKDLLKSFSEEETKINLLTKLNTKINRDYLDNSKYYFEKGYKKIYENNDSNKKEDFKKSKNEGGKEKIFIKKSKKVGFSNNIIYENNY